MQSGLNALGLGFQRLAIVVVMVAFAAVVGYALLIAVIVASQAVAAFGQ